jgi:Rps23 Pro-64 3,4-dihydroxylase Tpa1-like proline 4-hydroxylase
MNLNNKVVLREDIVLFENFLTEEECQNVLNYWDHSVEKGSLPWSPISFYESYASNLPDDEDMIKFGLPRDFFTNLEIKIQEATAIARGADVKKVSYHAQKWIPGAFANFHSDNSSDGEYNAFERSKWATFLYLNDNFTGGALNFKDHPITVQPKTGMLAAFAGGHHNEHEVQIVKSGDRYTIGSFWDYAESEYSDEKKAQWESEIAQVRAEQEVQFKEWEALKEKGITVEPRKYEEESN